LVFGTFVTGVLLLVVLRHNKTFRRFGYAPQRLVEVQMPSRSARAWIVATELFDELLIAVHEPETAFDLRLGWETFSTLAGDLKSTVGRCVWFS
jgi:hypothetical protein